MSDTPSPPPLAVPDAGSSPILPDAVALTDEPAEVRTVPVEPITPWHRVAPWVLTASALLSLVAIGAFLVVNVEWFKEHAESTKAESSPLYHLHLYHVHLSFLKRAVGLFSGFALLFTGLGVAFYTLQTMSRLGVDGPALKSQLATASPGLVCVLIGAVILATTVASSDSFQITPSAQGPVTTLEIEESEEPNVSTTEDP